jgi:hypothetical protein
MRFAPTKIEQRVSVLERELRKVRSELKSVQKKSQPPWWQRFDGSFKDDPLFDEIITAGNAHRHSLARRAR